MRFALTQASLALACALVVSACGGPAPLVPHTSTPEELAVFGPSVQYHAGREGQDFVMDGVVDGVPSLEVALVRGGQEVRRQPVTIQAARFALRLGPVADGDRVFLEGPGYRAAFTMSWPGRVEGGAATVSRPTARASGTQVVRARR